MLYRQHFHAAVVARHPGLANPEISKIIGRQWREEDQEVKDTWDALAEVRLPPIDELKFLKHILTVL